MVSSILFSLALAVQGPQGIGPQPSRGPGTAMPGRASQPAPEPATLSLLALAGSGVALGYRRRRKTLSED